MCRTSRSSNCDSLDRRPYPSPQNQTTRATDTAAVKSNNNHMAIIINNINNKTNKSRKKCYWSRIAGAVDAY